MVPPKNFKARPTTDIAKEALFNILEHTHEFSEMEVLDLFSGTGSISYEFASRECKKVVSIEKDYRSYAFIKETAELFNLKNLSAYKADAFRFIAKSSMQFSIIFADPPYDLPELSKIPDAVFASNILKPDGLFILEHSSNYDFSAHPNFWMLKNYSKVHFSFFRFQEDGKTVE
ncbi:MAG TPA: 16S rRNA (guanine(966)-N(2))-methyltransferase RsmD [Bacteroidales bacterium]|nr:16S rRNA (guanine(966)-N(2))-methyltransferase RsmD [Bacteroidales bacterium]